jgi:hypothetical protein
LGNWSGYNKLRDMIATFSAEDTEEKLSLIELNQEGLKYDFDTHELRFANCQERVKYELRMGKICTKCGASSKLVENSKNNNEKSENESA